MANAPSTPTLAGIAQFHRNVSAAFDTVQSPDAMRHHEWADHLARLDALLGEARTSMANVLLCFEDWPAHQSEFADAERRYALAGLAESAVALRRFFLTTTPAETRGEQTDG